MAVDRNPEVSEEAVKQGGDAFDVAFHGHGKSPGEAFAVGLAVAAPILQREERERLSKGGTDDLPEALASLRDAPEVALLVNAAIEVAREEGQHEALGLDAEELDCVVRIVGKATALDAGKPGAELRSRALAKLERATGNLSVLEKLPAALDSARAEERAKVEEALASAAKAPVPTEVWGEHGEEGWWKQGRDEAVEHARKALSILATLHSEERD